MPQDIIAIAIIRRAIGLDGLLGVEAFGDTFETLEYPARVYGGRDKDHVQEMVIDDVELRPRGYVLRLNNVTDRTAAEAFLGVTLYIEQSTLPGLEKDQFYHFDLIGLPVVTESGEQVGTVLQIESYPSMDALEVDMGKGVDTLLIPLIKQAVIKVDIAKKMIVVNKSYIEELM